MCIHVHTVKRHYITIHDRTKSCSCNQPNPVVYHPRLGRRDRCGATNQVNGHHRRRRIRVCRVFAGAGRRRRQIIESPVSQPTHQGAIDGTQLMPNLS